MDTYTEEELIAQGIYPEKGPRSLGDIAAFNVPQGYVAFVRRDDAVLAAGSYRGTLKPNVGGSFTRIEDNMRYASIDDYCKSHYVKKAVVLFGKGNPTVALVSPKHGIIATGGEIATEGTITADGTVMARGAPKGYYICGDLLGSVFDSESHIESLNFTAFSGTKTWFYKNNARVLTFSTYEEFTKTMYILHYAGGNLITYDSFVSSQDDKRNWEPWRP
jgi:hypothetical protein